MVRETGNAAEQFLRSVASGQADHLAERDQRAAAALQRVNTTPDWQTDCRHGPFATACLLCQACHEAMLDESVLMLPKLLEACCAFGNGVAMLCKTCRALLPSATGTVYFLLAAIAA